MTPFLVFAVQFLWFLIAWTAVAIFFVAPRLKHHAANDVVAIWLAPQLFRVMGLGLLVPNLAPGMPASFAVPTSAGDLLTSVLALIAIAALVQRRRGARTAAWVCNVVGSVDLVIALSHAALVGGVRFLEAQWYVPALGVPLMIVSHAMTFRALRSTGPDGR